MKPSATLFVVGFDVSSTKGSVTVFDYKLLHRGPANLSPSLHRPVVSMVFSKMFFLNSEGLKTRTHTSIFN